MVLLNAIQKYFALTPSLTCSKKQNLPQGDKSLNLHNSVGSRYFFVLATGVASFGYGQINSIIWERSSDFPGNLNLFPQVRTCRNFQKQTCCRKFCLIIKQHHMVLLNAIQKYFALTPSLTCSKKQNLPQGDKSLNLHNSVGSRYFFVLATGVASLGYGQINSIIWERCSDFP